MLRQSMQFFRHAKMNRQRTFAYSSLSVNNKIGIYGDNLIIPTYYESQYL